MRIAVVGTSGSGKTTLGARLARELGIAHIELDAINWQPGWRGLNAEDPVELVRRVDEATRGNAWVVEGGYAQVRSLIWSRATHLIWLDYSRGVIMPRVIRRSIGRALDRRELWNGNRERWRMLLTAEHPIRWAWDTWAPNRVKFTALAADPQFAHLEVHRLHHPRGVDLLVNELKAARDAAPPPPYIPGP